MEYRTVFDPENHATTPKSHPVNFKKLLETVNNIRIAIGIGEGKLEALPQGRLESPRQCVLARALSNGWKATVSNEISLVAPKAIRGTFDFNAAATALKSMGFTNVLVVDEHFCAERDCKSTGDPWKPTTIHFDPSKSMTNFIERYDEGQFPDLILKD